MKSIKIRYIITILTAALLTTASAMSVLAATRLGTVSDFYWDEDTYTLAHWDEVEDAYQYEVYLYRDDSKVADIKTKKLKYNFKSKMKVEGSYTFRVRALKKGSSYIDGSWSDYSEEMYISADYIEFLEKGGIIDTENSGPGAVRTAGWVLDDGGWWYRNADGTYPVNTWFQDTAGGSWYYFNEKGYMVTGWFEWNGNRYYCGADGAMYSGACTIDGVSYQFDQSGALIAS